MSQGTLTLTNNSTAVTGSGTAFIADLKPNDFIAVVVGGVMYTLGVTSVTNNTAVVLTTPYTGPTTQNAAWTAIPNATLVGITASLAADVSRAIRGLNLDKNNWQQVFSAVGDAEVKLADGSIFSGPSWGSINNKLSSKAEADDARIVGALQKTGGTMSDTIWSGAKSSQGFAFEKNPAAVASSGSNYYNRFARVFSRFNDSAFEIDHFESPGNYYACRFIVYNSYSAGTLAAYELRHTGEAYSSSGWKTFSDSRLKTEKKKIENALDKISALNGYTYVKFGLKQTGVIAQEVEKVLPEAVTVSGDYTNPATGDITKDALAISPGDLVGLLIEGIKELRDELSSLKKDINSRE